MRRGELVHVEDFAAGGRPALVSLAIVRGETGLGRRRAGRQSCLRRGHCRYRRGRTRSGSAAGEEQTHQR